MDSQGEKSSLLPPPEESPQQQLEQLQQLHHQQQHQQHQDSLQLQGMQQQQQQQQFLGFGIDPNWGGFSQMMHGQNRYVSLDGSQLIPGLSPSMDPLEALLGPFPCARVRGIPYEATVEDVLVFFQGLVVIDVVLVSDEESGEAFVVFANPMDFQMGLQRDHQNMGNRYLEIFQGKRSDYYAAISSQHHHWHVAAGLLDNTDGGEKVANGNNITGVGNSLDVPVDLSETFTPDDSAALRTSGLTSPARKNTNHRGRGNNGGSSYQGRGYGGRGGGNYHGGRGGYKGGHSNGGGIRDGLHTGYIRLRGLPFHATKQDILDFFKDYKPIESSVLLTYRVDGRATGEAYVAFNDAEDAKAAMSKHRSTIGSRYIELFISNKEEHARNVARSTPH